MLEQMFALRTEVQQSARGLGGRHHLHGDGLHYLCESCHPEFAGARARRSGTWLCPDTGRHMPGGWRHGASGLVTNYPLRHGFRHGPERCGRLPAYRWTELLWPSGHGRVITLEGIIITVLVAHQPHCDGRYSLWHSKGAIGGHWVVHPVYWPVLGRARPTGANEFVTLGDLTSPRRWWPLSVWCSPRPRMALRFREPSCWDHPQHRGGHRGRDADR